MKKLLYFIIIALISIHSGFAQSVNTSTDGKIPTLNGHTFPSIGLIRSSFVTTNLQANLGIGSSNSVRIPGIIIGDHEIFSFEGKLLFINMKIQYQQKFTPWLALYFSMNIAGRVGTDMSTILADGVNTMSGGDIGWLIRIYKREKLNLSGSINVKNLTGSFINVTEYFREIINDNPYPSLIKKVPSMSIGAGIHGAYAFNPSFGLQFHLEGAYGESFEREENSRAYFIGGITGDVDFLPKQNVPLGLALGYTMTSAPEIVMNSGGYANLLLGKIGYTGSDEFELGLQFSYYKVKLNNAEDDPFISSVMLVLKFYF